MISSKLNSISDNVRLEKTLAAAISSEKVFPIWLFHGPFGVGKKTLAYKIAKCLLANHMPSDGTLDIDISNKVHKLVDSQTHPDFFVIKKSNESTSIDDIRDLLSKLQKTSLLSKWKVAILENASSFNKNICNALLKFLEEPTKNTVVILICENTGNIPKTLLSRCAKVYVRPLDTVTIKNILDSKQIPNSDKLAYLSCGSIGYALQLNDRNGLEIYLRVLRGFSSEEASKITLKYIIENNIHDDFSFIRQIFESVLYSYTKVISSTEDAQLNDERNIFNKYKSRDLDTEVEKIVEIISMLNKCEQQMTDKSAVLASVYERFFN